MSQKAFSKIWVLVILLIIIGGIFALQKLTSKVEESQKPNRTEVAILPKTEDFLSSNAKLLKEVNVDFNGDTQKEVVFIEEISNQKPFSNFLPEVNAAIMKYELTAGEECAYQTRLVLLEYDKIAGDWKKSSLEEICGSRLADYNLEITDLNNDGNEELLFVGHLEGTDHFLRWEFFARVEDKVKKVVLSPSLESLKIDGKSLVLGVLSPSIKLVEGALVYYMPLTDDKFATIYPVGVVYYEFDGKNLMKAGVVKCANDKLDSCIQENLPR